MREDMEAQRRLKEQNEQHALQAQIQLNTLQEEAEALRKRFEISEREKEFLKKTLDTEEVERVASEGSIALPPLPEEDELASPRKRRRGETDSLKENMDPEAMVVDKDDEDIEALKEDIRHEKRLRLRAEEEAHFLKMECQFGVCSCRIAEQKGERYTHDDQFTPMPSATKAQRISPSSPPQADQPPAITNHSNLPLEPFVTSSSAQNERPSIERNLSETTAVRFSPNSGTFSKHPSPTSPAFAPDLAGGAGPSTIINDSSPNPSTPEKQKQHPTHGHPPIPATTHTSRPNQTQPKTPYQRPLPNPPPRTVSHFNTTTTIPLKANEDDPVFSPAPNTPGGISREEALERIRQRRGRARSFAVGIGGTPGRGSVRENGNGREGEGRVISAPVGGRHCERD